LSSLTVNKLAIENRAYVITTHDMSLYDWPWLMSVVCTCVQLTMPLSTVKSFYCCQFCQDECIIYGCLIGTCQDELAPDILITGPAHCVYVSRDASQCKVSAILLLQFFRHERLAQIRYPIICTCVLILGIRH